MAGPETDINKVIESAVQARVEAAVLETLSSGNAMQAMVIAALNQKVGTGNYNRDEKPLVTVLLQKTIEEQAKKVVAEEIVALAPTIREEVRKALKKSIGVISDQLVNGFVEHAAGRYPSIKVEFGGN